MRGSTKEHYSGHFSIDTKDSHFQGSPFPFHSSPAPLEKKGQVTHQKRKQKEGALDAVERKKEKE
jgi:hypothetical protein